MSAQEEEHYGHYIEQEQDQELLRDLSLEAVPGTREEGFFPVTPDPPRRGSCPHLSGSPHSRHSTGNLRSKYRPRDNILMAGTMDLATVTATQLGHSHHRGHSRAASVRPRDQLRFAGGMELESSHAAYRPHGGRMSGEERRGSCPPRNNLKLGGSVDYITNNHDFKGAPLARAALARPRHHLQNDGIIDLKTTTSENFNFEGKVEKVDRVNRDNLRLSGERALKTTHHDFKNYGEVSSSELRAVPQWFIEPRSNPIIIS